MPVNIKIFQIKANTVTGLPLEIREAPDGVSVIGGFDAEIKVSVDGTLTSVLSKTGRGHYVLGLLEVGKEPTNHALADIARQKEAFEKWGGRTVLVCTDQAQLDRLNAEIADGRYGQLPSGLVLAIDSEGAVARELTKELKASTDRKPVFIVADTFNKAYFLSQGYTIGLGEQLQTVLKKISK